LLQENFPEHSMLMGWFLVSEEATNRRSWLGLTVAASSLIVLASALVHLLLDLHFGLAKAILGLGDPG
jgi:hypothetical protein